MGLHASASHVLAERDPVHPLRLVQDNRGVLLGRAHPPTGAVVAVGEHRHLLAVAEGGRIEGPEARKLMTDLIKEYADLFPGPWFHLGGDEYFGCPWYPKKITGENSPQLLDYARRKAGPEATLLDGFNTYMNVLAERGKRAKMWNDHIHPGQGVVDIDRRMQVEAWIRWNTAEPSVEDYIRAGYDVVNGYGDHLYFILTPGQQHETGKKSAQGIYDLCTPRTFLRRPTKDMQLPADAPMPGAHLSIWCDNPDFQTEQKVSDSVRPWLRSSRSRYRDRPNPPPVPSENAIRCSELWRCHSVRVGHRACANRSHAENQALMSFGLRPG
ncbi:family 20 glycosylhydrolase [Streptomyces sp. NPDC057486]|uniref:family 20 glycosylhydrolase n=1 Tax=Streptomyces sp. NPDC057486 TaxID=3346145 RepID=UPI0036B1B2A2